jgi:multiple antibiotic resistance protein
VRAVNDFFSVFLPMLAITNVLPVLPVALAILEEAPELARNQMKRRALTTVLCVGVVITIAGGPMLRAWGVSLDDLRIAGGVVLLIFAVHDLLFTRMDRKQRAKDMDESLDAQLHSAHEFAIVPLGIPILLGPAGMTALLVFGQTRGVVETLAAFGANFAINALLLLNADLVRRTFGRAVVRATGKVMGLVLAALAVSMLRTGIQNVVAG